MVDTAHAIRQDVFADLTEHAWNHIQAAGLGRHEGCERCDCGVVERQGGGQLQAKFGLQAGPKLHSTCK